MLLGPPASPEPAIIDTSEHRAPAPASRHVWIDPVDGALTRERHAGLLHAWQPESSGWSGLVTYLVDDGGPAPVAVTQWVSGSVIHRA